MNRRKPRRTHCIAFVSFHNKLVMILVQCTPWLNGSLLTILRLTRFELADLIMQKSQSERGRKMILVEMPLATESQS